jgi:hypothetical protein
MGVRLVFALGGPAYDRAPLDAAGLAVCTMDDLGAEAAALADRPSLQARAGGGVGGRGGEGTSGRGMGAGSGEGIEGKGTDQERVKKLPVVNFCL